MLIFNSCHLHIVIGLKVSNTGTNEEGFQGYVKILLVQTCCRPWGLVGCGHFSSGICGPTVYKLHEIFSDTYSAEKIQEVWLEGQMSKSPVSLSATIRQDITC